VFRFVCHRSPIVVFQYNTRPHAFHILITVSRLQILTINSFSYSDCEVSEPKMKFTPLVLGLMAAVAVTAKDKDKKKHFKNE
jgi:hypothetical protein